jgi:hypothetical protein
MSEKEELLTDFNNNFILFPSQHTFIEPVSNKTLTAVAYYKKMDMILILYKTEIENEYCAHSTQATTEYPDLMNPPNFGFSSCVSYHDALEWITTRYLEIRKKNEHN